MVIINLVLAGVVVLAIPLLFGEQYRSSIPVAEILLVASSLLGIKRSLWTRCAEPGRHKSGPAPR